MTRPPERAGCTWRERLAHGPRCPLPGCRSGAGRHRSFRKPWARSAPLILRGAARAAAACLQSFSRTGLPDAGPGGRRRGPPSPREQCRARRARSRPPRGECRVPAGPSLVSRSRLQCSRLVYSPQKSLSPVRFSTDFSSKSSLNFCSASNHCWAAGLRPRSPSRWLTLVRAQSPLQEASPGGYVGSSLRSERCHLPTFWFFLPKQEITTARVPPPSKRTANRQ